MVRSNDDIPTLVQSQLVALGIPASKHTCGSLAAFFPREFNIGAAGLDAENLARVLIHFAKRGLIALPTARAGSFVKKVKPGWHCCRFYLDDEQLLEMVAPYFAEGLHNNEGCLWVLPSSVDQQGRVRGRRSLRERRGRASRQRPARALVARQLVPGPGGTPQIVGRDPRAALVVKQGQALAKGFKLLRAAGDAGWVSGTEQSKDFIDYEMKVNSEIGNTQIAAVCTFRADVTADELIAIVTAHQDAICTEAVA